MFEGVFFPESFFKAKADIAAIDLLEEDETSRLLKNPRPMTDSDVLNMPFEIDLEVWHGEGNAVDSFMDDDGTQYVVVIFHLEDPDWPHIYPPIVNHQSDLKSYIYVYDDESEVIDGEYDED